MASIVQVTDDNFEAEVANSKEPVLLDFWAEWCGPCKAIAPKLEELSKSYEGKIKIAKINVDENQQTPAKFSIRGIPTLILFKGGQVVDQLVGNHPADAIEDLIKRSF